ncbi:serine/threonine-protein kinase [Nocardiopsis gilva]|uniref:serine/threonine-protein kinase n=1 Tax=Nocardiopsis gilva TaxID=280236 RepID=UPI00034BB2C8|nr:serine/threonine-protein kinase [Nocardiopsis gilva]
MRVDGFHSLALAYRGRESQVYRAISARVEAPVALKVMHNAAGFDEIIRVRDLGTAQGVVPLLDVARTASGESVKVMPFYPEGSYTEILEQSGPVHPREVVRVGRAVAGALSVMHSRGLLHNEIVPSNILRASSSAVLTDFGSTAEIGAPPPKLRTSSELVFHAPPEVLRGTETSPASDVYELASVLWTLLAGHAPFSGDNASFLGPQQYAAVALKTPAAPVRRRDVPWRLNNVLLRALAKDPADRYATPSEFAVELERTWTERPDTASAAAPSAPPSSAPTAAPGPSAPTPPSAPSGPNPAHAQGRRPQAPAPEPPQPMPPRPETAEPSPRPTGPQTPPSQHAPAQASHQPSGPQAPAAPPRGTVPPSGPQTPMAPPPSPVPPTTPSAPAPPPSASQPSGPHAGMGPQAPIAPQPPVAPSPSGPQRPMTPPSDPQAGAAAPPAAPPPPQPQPAAPHEQVPQNPHPAPQAPPEAPSRPIDAGPGDQARQSRHAAGPARPHAGPPARPAAPEPVHPTPPEPAPTASRGGSAPTPPAAEPAARPAKSSHLAENTGVHNLLERIRGEASADLIAEQAWSRLEGWSGSADSPPLPGLPGGASNGGTQGDGNGREEWPDFSDPGPVHPPRWRRHLHIVAAAASIIVITGAAGGLSMVRPGPGLSTSNAQTAELLSGDDGGKGKKEQDGKEGTEGEKGDDGSTTTEKKSDPLPEVAAPSNVSLQDNLSSVQVQWTDNSGGKASYFVVGGATYEDAKTLVRTGAGVTVAQVTTDDTVSEYCFTVVAVDGRSAASSEVCTNRAGARAEAEAERKRKEEEEKKKDEKEKEDDAATNEGADAGTDADAGSDSKTDSGAEKKSSS